MAAIACLLLVQVVVAASAADRTSAGPTALLEDAIEALALRKTALATHLFEQIIDEFPGTPESARAHTELKALGTPRSAPGDDGGDVWSDDGRAVAPNEGSAHAVSLRREFLTSVGDRVFFAENSASIGGRARAMIENQARWLNRRPDVQITIIGRADDGGSQAVETELSLRRADAVRDRLVESGVEAGRIRVEARGGGDKIALCQTFMCKAQNRNVETYLSLASARFGGATVDRPGRVPDPIDGATAQTGPVPRIDDIGRP